MDVHLLTQVVATLTAGPYMHSKLFNAPKKMVIVVSFTNENGVRKIQFVEFIQYVYLTKCQGKVLVHSSRL